MTSLKKIAGISLSPREIDIIACLLSGKGVKAIASFLQLSPRTVESYIRSIMLKFGCNSREGIIEFVEKSEHFTFAKNHYLYLLGLEASSNSLAKNLSFVLYKADKPITNEQRYQKFLFNLVKYLKQQEIDIILKENIEICCPPALSSAIGFICEKGKKYPLIFILEDNYLVCGYLKVEEYNCINIAQDDLNTKQTFDKLGRIIECVLKDTLPSSADSLQIKIDKKKENNLPKNPHYIKKFGFLTKFSWMTNFIVFLSSCPKKVLLGLTVTFLLIIPFVYQDIFFKGSCQTNTLRTELNIPHPNALLERPKILKKINSCFKRQNSEIRNVILIGPGGAGKTTVARMYARQQDSPLIWEINAESEESLLHSFKDLAFALSTPAEKKDLDFIFEIPDSKEQQKQLLIYVKRHLRNKSSWILIYDDVQIPKSIVNFIPNDHHVWGKGKVILTTKDVNSQNTSYISPENAIFIEELETKEAFDLLTKILYNPSFSQSPLSQQEEILEFLKLIPAFPLDISIACYYIKNMGLSFSQYKERIQKFTKEFDHAQSSLLQNVTHYSKTRYGIISSSLEKIIEADKDFKELLFLVCSMNAQNIPISFLNSCKNPLITEKFIYFLNKYALITKNDKSSTQFFSLHQSTQTIGAAFFANSIQKIDQKLFLENAANIICELNGLSIKLDRPSLLFTREISLRVALFPHLKALLNSLERIDLPLEWKKEVEVKLVLALGDTYYECFDNMFIAQQYYKNFFSDQTYLKHFHTDILANMLRKLGIICINIGDLEEGIHYCEKSISLCKKSQLELLKVFNLKHIGFAYAKMNNFKKAIAYTQQALNSLSNLNGSEKDEAQANLYEQLATIYSRAYINKKEAFEAKNYLSNALQILNASELFHENISQKPKTSPYFITKCRLALGMLYNNLGQYKSAIKEGFQEAEYISNHYMLENGNFFLKALIELGFGEALLREGRLKDAEEKLTSSIDIMEKILGLSSHYTCHAKIYRVEVYFRLGKIEEAYKECNAILQIKPKHSDAYDSLMHLISYYHAAIISYTQGKHKDARQHFLTFMTCAQAFCQSFLTEPCYKKYELKNIFHSHQQNEESFPEFFHKSTYILKSIYGDNHPFIEKFVTKNMSLVETRSKNQET